MPPRIRLSLLSRSALASPSHVFRPFILPVQSRPTGPKCPPQPQCSQARHASILSSLSENPGHYNKRIRRGRGPASGKGKTSGRGHKGQKQHGKVPTRKNPVTGEIVKFGGGQTPDWVLNPPKGAYQHFSADMSPVNLDRIQDWIDQGRLDPSKPITMKELSESRCLHGVKDGVKLLGRGADALRTPINIIVSRASATAIAKVESLGGTVMTRFYTKPAIRRVISGLTHPADSIMADPTTLSTLAFPKPESLYRFRLPDPTSRKDIEFYRDPAKRGYLTHLVADGEGPSLFFKTPGQRGRGGKKAGARKAKSQAGENRIW